MTTYHFTIETTDYLNFGSNWCAIDTPDNIQQNDEPIEDNAESQNKKFTLKGTYKPEDEDDANPKNKDNMPLRVIYESNAKK